MNKKFYKTNSDTAILGTIEDGVQRYSIGKTLLRKVAAEAGAVRKVGRAWRFDIATLDEYINGAH